MDGRPNCRNKAAFFNSSGDVWTGPICKFKMKTTWGGFYLKASVTPEAKFAVDDVDWGLTLSNKETIFLGRIDLHSRRDLLTILKIFCIIIYKQNHLAVLSNSNMTDLTRLP